MIAWSITSILAATVIFITYWLLTWTNSYWRKRGVKYHKSAPIIGIMKDLILMKKGLADIFGEIYNKYQGEKFVGYFQFMTPSIMIRDPELVNHVLVKDFSHFEDRTPPLNNSSDLFCRNFSNFSGSEWKNLRTKLMPAFSTGKMKTMIGTMKECSDDLVRYLEDKTDRDFEAKDLILRVALNITGRIAFGLNIDTLNEKEEKSIAFLKRSTVFFTPSFFTLSKFLILVSIPKIRNVLELKLTDADVDSFFRAITKDALKHRYETGTKCNDFLQLMIELNEKEKESKSGELFTDDFIAAQTFLYISAGSETISAVAEFTLYELALHQDLQKKVQDEISKVLSTDEFSYETVSKLTYMEQFINETLRLHAVSPTLSRVCTHRYKLPGTDVIIEKGNFVHIYVNGLHYNPLYFPDPEKFDPDRFENMDAVPKNVFYPFGGGPRMCIGMRLGMLQLKIILAVLLSNYTVTLNKKTNLPLKLSKTSILVSVDGGVWVNFHKTGVCCE